MQVKASGLGASHGAGPARAMRVYPAGGAIAENGTGHSIAECGHWLAEEQPEAVLRHLLDIAAPL